MLINAIMWFNFCNELYQTIISLHNCKKIIAQSIMARCGIFET